MRSRQETISRGIGAARAASSAAILVATLTALAACDRGEQEPVDTSVADAAPEHVESAVPTEFAESLGIDLSEMRQTPSGLYIQDLVEGRGLAARSGHVVVVHYTGWLPNGEQFDTTLGAEARSFQLGARRDVITGWEEGVAGMRIGGKRRLVVPPQLAYGARGVPGAIPPNATLVYEFELLEIRM
jgi:FKBP-type peptidyl-prolyl cis-trans isomerase